MISGDYCVLPRLSISLKSCSCMVVFTRVWSDMVCSVVGSYSTRFVGSVASIRSMHNFFVPFSYVYLAGGSGWSPFKMYQPFASHVSITHYALIPTVVSSLSLRISISPSFGWRLPTRVFQSPHMTDPVCGGMCPRRSSISFLTASSSMPRVCRFVVGGMYTFPIQIISPPCPYIPTPCAYSFPAYRRTFTLFFTSTAIPPLLSLARLSS